MFNPYILLVALLALLVTAFGADRFGYHRAKNECAAAVATSQNEAIADANKRIATETKRAVAAAKSEADARVRAAGIRRKGEIDAATKAKLECSRDADSQRLLLESIRLANDSAASPIPMPDAVHADP